MRIETYKDRKWLERKYLVDELTTSEIAEECKCNRKNISYWLNKFEIPTRKSHEESKRTLLKMSEANKGRVPYNKGVRGKDLPYFNSIKRGEDSPMWKGGRMTTSSGYIFIMNKDHPHSNKDGYVLEHRLVMENIIGRYLTKDEVVHHRNKIRDDNKERNLFLFPSNSAHTSYHNYIRDIDSSMREEEFMEEVYGYAN